MFVWGLQEEIRQRPLHESTNTNVVLVCKFCSLPYLPSNKRFTAVLLGDHVESQKIGEEVEVAFERKEFCEIDPISILTFLKKIRRARKSIGLHEAAVTRLFSYFMKKPESLSLEARLSPKMRYGKGLHDKRLFSYLEIINYTSARYATDDNMARAIKDLESYYQCLEISAALYAKRLYIKALRNKIFYKEKRVRPLFVEGLGEPVCVNMHVNLRQHPRAPFIELARYADVLTKIADRIVCSSGK